MPSLDELGVRITDLIKDFTEDVKDGLEDRLDETA